MTPKVAIIILNWNGKKDTIECLESLKKITYPNYGIILVDNGSNDGSFEYFKEKYPYIEIIENGKNLGFAEGNNVGIRSALSNSADYVLLLNNDIEVDAEFLTELVNVGESDKSIGFVGPKGYFFYRKNTLQFTGGGKIDLIRGKATLIGRGEIDTGKYDKCYEVGYVNGACLLCKTEVIRKIGMLDPFYFIYWEETDWCLSGRKIGYKSIYAYRSKIWHKVGATTASNFTTYLLSRNMFYFIKKHGTRKQYLLFILYFFGFQFWLTSIVHLIFHKDKNTFISFLKGVIDGLKISYL
jgi:GT2 family glycosyltransferase